MKLLKVSLQNSRILANDFSIDFINKTRIFEDDINTSVEMIKNGIGTLNVNVIAGVNASGKTASLRLIEFVLEIFTEHASLDNEAKINFLNDFYNNQELIFKVYWVDNQTIYYIESKIDKIDNNFIFIAEKISQRKLIKSIAKSRIYDLSSFTHSINRNELDLENAKFLGKKRSISIIGNDNPKMQTFSNLTSIDFNVGSFNIDTEISKDVLRLLDPNVEYIKKVDDSKDMYKLKFIDMIETEVSLIRLNEILSSGTIKGYRLFSTMYYAFKYGGYLLVDEIENHMHMSLVKLIINLFENRKINVKNAKLIFSTHYPELLDNVVRNDSINIVTSRSGKVVCNNIVNYNIRNKSDISRKNLFESGKIESVPSYESVEIIMRKLQEVSNA